MAFRRSVDVKVNRQVLSLLITVFTSPYQNNLPHYVTYNDGHDFERGRQGGGGERSQVEGIQAVGSSPFAEEKHPALMHKGDLHLLFLLGKNVPQGRS